MVAFKSVLYSIHSTMFFHVEEQLRADLEAAKALSKAGTDPQVHYAWTFLGFLSHMVA